MNLLFEIATAVLDYLSSQQRQPRYALSGKEEVSWQRKGWIPCVALANHVPFFNVFMHSFALGFEPSHQETVDDTLIVNGTSSSQEKAEISGCQGRRKEEMESVASETVDDTLIVNGTSSSQEKAEISATYSWSHSPERDHAAATIRKYYNGFRARRILAAAATRIQKHYRGFRTRRNLADSIIAVELLWQTTLSRTPNTDVDVYIESEKHILSLLKWAETRVEKIDPRRRYSQNSYFFYLIWGDQCFLGSWKFDSNKIRDLKRSGESLFTIGKPTSVELRMDTTSSTQNWISELTKTWTTWKGALPRWLEVWWPTFLLLVTSANEFYNPCLLNLWINAFVSRSSSTLQISLWNWRLDVGDGKTVNHPECSREKLRQERNTYLELVSKSKVVESIMSLVLRSVSNTERDINNNQREHLEIVF
ncbi:hypothetical protein POTOM_050883 [Populus tomentosa]|uniref:Uncharacterized protein n=1 Tax=Populus tomentosa TaxID=118781 RepID=A0A8X7YCY8_POPTO|nr:hypothetical protein POTOM_050883 [Populus tomentosa]